MVNMYKKLVAERDKEIALSAECLQWGVFDEEWFEEICNPNTEKTMIKPAPKTYGPLPASAEDWVNRPDLYPGDPENYWVFPDNDDD